MTKLCLSRFANLQLIIHAFPIVLLLNKWCFLKETKGSFSSLCSLFLSRTAASGTRRLWQVRHLIFPDFIDFFLHIFIVAQPEINNVLHSGSPRDKPTTSQEIHHTFLTASENFGERRIISLMIHLTFISRQQSVVAAQEKIQEVKHN